MRVLALAHQYVPVRCAGAETMLHGMLRALARRGHEVDVTLSRQQGEPYTLDGVRVWPWTSKRDVFRWLSHADVLVSHLENTPRATFLGQLNNIPVVVVHHNTFAVTKRALVTPQARVDLVVVNSEWMREDLTVWFRAIGRSQPWTIVCRPLVDPAEYATTPGDRVTLVNLRRDERDHAGGTIGKGADLFWQLAERMPRTRFLAVKGAYGQQLIRDLPNVEVLDHVPHDRMREVVYARTRILIVPSSYESWGRVAVEAMCSGIPVIAHPTPGLRESLGDAGIFVDRGDVDGWVRALRHLSRQREWERASARARARAIELDPTRDLERWCTAVEEVAARGRARLAS